MANYNLGSVQGEVRITYDGKGIEQGTEDVKTYRDELGRLRDENGRFVKDTERSSETARKFGKDLSNLDKDVKRLGNGLVAISKIPVLAAAASEVVAFGGSLTPILGLTAVLPGILGTVAAAGATVALGMKGMGDAMTAVAEGDAAALEEALKSLAPEAREVVREVAQLKPAWDAMRLDVQNALFKDLGQTVKVLGNAYLPALRVGAVDVADSFSEMAKLSAEALIEPSTVSSLNKLFAQTGLTVDALGGSLGNVLAGIINVAAVGAEWLPRWAENADWASAAFLKWSQSAEGQQQINQWISQGADALGKLVDIIVNLGNIASGVWAAMDTATGGTLENMVALTAQMSEWVNSAEGQETLVGIFTALHQIFMAMLPILGGLVVFVGQLAQWFNALPAPVQSALASFIAFSLVFGKILSLGAPVIGFLIKYRTEIAAVAGWIGKLGGWIGTAIMWIGRLGAAFLVNAARIAASWLIAMGPIGWVIAAVIALVALIIIYWDEIKAATIIAWNAITSWLGTAWEWIKSTATSVWGAITGFFSTIWNGIVAVWNSVWAVIGGTVTTIWNGIVTFLQFIWNVIVQTFRLGAIVLLAIFFTLWNPIWELTQIVWANIWGFLQGLWQLIVTVATAVWNGLSALIIGVWTAIWGFLQPIVQGITDFLINSWNTIAAFASSIWSSVSSTVSTAWDNIYNWIAQKLEAASALITSVWNTVSSFLSGIWNTIASAAASLWERIYSAIKGPLDRAWQAVVDIGNRIKGIAGEALTWLVNAGRNIVTGLWNGISAMGSWLYGQIIGWARSVIPGPILQFLGIASPSKFMRDEVGKNIPPGVAEGIDAKSQIATAAAATMAAKVGEAARVATDQEMSVRTSLLPSSALQNLPADVRARLGSLALSAGSVAGTTSAIASAATPAAVSNSNTRSMVIDKLVLDVKGIIDPTDPVSWREFGEEVRELLTEVEASYR